MRRVSSFHVSAVDSQQLGAVMRESLALERARVYRHLFVERFGPLALAVGVGAIGFHWLSPLAGWLAVGLCLMAPLWAWVAELRCGRRLSRHLARLEEKHTGGPKELQEDS